MSAFMRIAPYCPRKSLFFCEAFVRTSKAFNKQLRTEDHITHSKPAPWERRIEKVWDVNGHALQSPDLQGAPQKPRLPPGSVSEPPQACVTQEYLQHRSLSSALWSSLPLQPPFPASMTMSPRAPPLCRSSLWATQEEGAREWRVWEGSIHTSMATYWMDST